MSENKDRQITSISKAQTLEEIGEFWDTHSLDDYWEETREVEFEVRAKQRKRVTLEPQISSNSKPKRVFAESFPKHWSICS